MGYRVEVGPDEAPCFFYVVDVRGYLIQGFDYIDDAQDYCDNLNCHSEGIEFD